MDPARELRFDVDDPSPVVAEVEALLAARSGWVNLRPELEPDAEPPPRGIIGRLFSNRGDPVPLATWAAPTRPGAPAMVGIQHGLGARALPFLEEAGASPTFGGWRRAADSVRRGLVLEVPESAPVAEVVRWLLDAATVMTDVELTGEWRASVYEG